MRQIKLTNHHVDLLLFTNRVSHKYQYLRRPPTLTKLAGCCGGRIIEYIDYNSIKKMIAEEKDINPILDALYTDSIEIHFVTDGGQETVVRSRT